LTIQDRRISKGRDHWLCEFVGPLDIETTSYDHFPVSDRNPNVDILPLPALVFGNVGCDQAPEVWRFVELR